MNLQDWLKCDHSSYSKNILEIGDVNIVSMIGIYAYGIRLNIKVAYFDNAAYNKNILEQLVNLMPVAASDLSIIMTSSGAISDSVFAAYYDDAILGLNDFNAICVPWNDLPSRTEEFKDKMIALLGQEAWNLEFFGCNKCSVAK